MQRTRDHDRAGGLNRALYEAPRPGQPPKLADNAAAHRVAMACVDAPEGRDPWTLELLPATHDCRQKSENHRDRRDLESFEETGHQAVAGKKCGAFPP